MSGDSHASWVFDTVRQNTAYNSETGEGAIGVEFAGSAVSSPSSYSYDASDEFYRTFAEGLVEGSPSLQYGMLA